MRIFLAGATGVIGRRLVPLLVGRGHSVTGFVRRDTDADWLRSLGVKAVRGDVFDADGVRRAVALAAPDVVMHQLTDLKGGNRQANSEMRVTGTRHLVDAALAVGWWPEPVISGGERQGWARGASNEYARKELHWTPAWPSWRDGFAAL